MNTLPGMCRHIVLHHRLLAVVLILYLLAGGYVSFGNFHHVHLRWIAGTAYQAEFERGATTLKFIGFLFVMYPLYCLLLEFHAFNHVPTGWGFIKNYGLNIFMSWGTLACIFFWRQDPGMVTGDNSIFIPLFLLTWLSTNLFLAGLTLLKLMQCTK